MKKTLKISDKSFSDVMANVHKKNENDHIVFTCGF